LDRSSLRANLLFARTFLKHPLMLGSLIPSSPSLVKRLAQQIDWENVQVMVEYGPGVGTITTAMLRQLRPDGVLVAIDYNRDFTEYLRQTIPDPRLRVAHASAAHVEQVLASLDLEGADCVVSGIPHSTLTPQLRAGILESTRRVLRPGGTFIVYQFTGAVLPQLEQVFGEVRQERELMNILPARIFCCSR
jgi:phospholipid N-methyltransferase